MRCLSCDLVFMNKQLSNESAIEFYKNYNKDRSANIDATEKRQLCYQLDANFVNNLLGPNAIVLDFGCGEGGFLEYIQAQTKYGIELDSTALNGLPSSIHGFNNVQTFLSANINSLDAIIFRGTLQYVSSLSTLLPLLSFISKGGCIFIFSLPNSRAPLANILKSDWSMCNGIEHLHLHSPVSFYHLFVR